MIDFLSEAQTLFLFSQAIRRDLHQHPEIGYQEVRTAGVVIRELTELGLELHTGIAETGVIGIIEGTRPGPVVMIRFDMDALPVSEETGADYASCSPGVMHACGHDGHVAIGLTVAKILHKYRNQLPGTIKLVFQPAEEGMNGAERMVKEGALANPKPDYAIGAHVWNERPVGWIAASAGPLMAGAAIFKIKISGKGGHGALPQQTVDPVLAAAQVVSSLQSIVARNISPLDSAVISVTTIHAGEAFNVIPPSAELTGTLRWFRPDVQKQVVERLKQLVMGVSGGMGCDAEITIHDLTPAVENDPVVAASIQRSLRQYLPETEVITSYQTMGSEDMSFFLREIPGCFIMVGSNNADRGLKFGHHHPKFDFDETALSLGAAALCSAAYDLLQQKW